ncbi:MAG: PNGase F N-terminal domain-containing protein [Bacteroidota bacterium]|nr:peptide-N-glycosidase [Odoribacter sp.]MDP3642835.1 PNGase F N-terminal domain-containing protein [Bacteroidota bacterium]
MRKLLFFAILNILANQNFAATKKLPEVVEISYQTVVNGKVRNDGSKNWLLCSEVASKSWTENDSKKLLPTIAKETSYIDFGTKNTFQLAVFPDGKTINTPLAFSEYPALTETNETAVILGYNCKHLKTSLRSNSIDIWYTTELGVKGTPAMAYGIPDGLVLKIVRNGNYEIVATEVKPLKRKDPKPIIPAEMGESLELPLYKHRITENLITTVNVFTYEQISFGNEIVNPSDNNSEKTFKYSSGTVILKKVKLPVVPDDTQLFVELYQHSNGDAYDRTGSVFLIPEDQEQSFLDGLRNGIAGLPVFQTKNGKSYQGVIATDRFSPLVEIMRFFTSFGIGQFNDKVTVYGQQWEDSTLFKQDVSELLPMLQGERWIGVFIGNYDKGGHRVSLKLKYYPGSMEISDKPNKKYWTLPLFNTLNVMEMSGQEYGTMFENDSLKVGFDVPEGVKNVRMRYITTGHGGWGAGDEFNQKMNTVLLDGNILFQYTPWRSDCATFRKYNPASGNFWNGVTSSDYSRSGWCPGTATNPVFYPVSNLQPGKHQIKVAIPLGKNEGGSFSSWNVSGVLIGEYE